MDMNRNTNTKLADILFICSLSNGNGRVAVGCRGKDIQRGGNRIIERSLGCIRTWWNMDLSELRLTTRPSILKWTWWPKYPHSCCYDPCKTSFIFKHVLQFMSRPCHACIQAGRSNFKQLL
ncbi:hypothetical protein TNCV_1270271 [Trichonephila clavipes]|nr:hypothetical protein TNCV_1270271 [Trichonephila clavipes]